jgi:hypothetical protein
MSTEKLDVRVEVDGAHIVLVFPRKMDDIQIHWSEAYEIGRVLEMAANDVAYFHAIIDIQAVIKEQAQVRMTTHKDHVVVLVDYTDRLSFSPESAVLVARAIKKAALDAQLLDTRGVRLVYDKVGVLRRIFHHKDGMTQRIR